MACFAHFQATLPRQPDGNVRDRPANVEGEKVRSVTESVMSVTETVKSAVQTVMLMTETVISHGLLRPFPSDITQSAPVFARRETKKTSFPRPLARASGCPAKGCYFERL